MLYNGATCVPPIRFRWPARSGPTSSPGAEHDDDLLLTIEGPEDARPMLDGFSQLASACCGVRGRDVQVPSSNSGGGPVV